MKFDSNWQRIFVTALTFLLDQAIRDTYWRSGHRPRISLAIVVKVANCSLILYSLLGNVNVLMYSRTSVARTPVEP